MVAKLFLLGTGATDVAMSADEKFLFSCYFNKGMYILDTSEKSNWSSNNPKTLKILAKYDGANTFKL